MLWVKVKLLKVFPTIEREISENNHQKGLCLNLVVNDDMLNIRYSNSWKKMTCRNYLPMLWQIKNTKLTEFTREIGIWPRNVLLLFKMICRSFSRRKFSGQSCLTRQKSTQCPVTKRGKIQTRINGLDVN